NHFHSMNLHSGYRFAGFGMGAFYSTGGSHADIPEVVTGGALSQTHTGEGAYGFNITHMLPFQGSIAGAFSRSNFDTNFLGNESSGTIDLLAAQAAVHPFQRFSLSGSASYSDNLSGQIIQQIVTAAGAAVASDHSNQSSNSLDL